VRFSVLLPTRNGGPYLGDAVASVLDQRGDFELVVADNANTDETKTVLAASAADQRLRVIRSDEVVTVTENWLRALRAARGEYLLLIGDDDLLLPGFFDRVDALLGRYRYPDCLTINAFSYVAPGAFGPGAPAFWAPRHFDMAILAPERELPARERLQIVKDMFRFQVRFPLNMQLTLFSKSAVAAVPGDLFRAPFPDHFALNSFLLRAPRMVVVDETLLVVGVSPKSFGHYFYGGQQARGLHYLGSESSFPGRVEGSELLNSMSAWLLELRHTYPELATISISRWRYLSRQINHWYRDVEFGRMSKSTFLQRARALRLHEMMTLLAPMAAYRLLRRWRRRRAGLAWNYLGDTWPALIETASPSIADFAARLTRSPA
jgi:glycosyltransferase involved in cell wall biosynthesis